MSKFLLALTVSLLACGCYSGRKGHDRERSYNKPYQRKENELKVRMFVFHQTDSLSHVYYKLDNSQLLYKKADTNSYFSARVKFRYRLLAYQGSSQVIDSATIAVEDRSEGQPPVKTLAGSFAVRIGSGSDLHLEVYATDENSRKDYTYYLPAEKTSVFSQQNFLLSDSTGTPLFSNKQETGRQLRLQNLRLRNASLKIDYYSNSYALPPPPFSQKMPDLIPASPDSTRLLTTGPNGADFTLKILRRGIIFIHPDTVNKTGCTVLGVEKNFPKVQSHDQMIAASRYIMNKEEHQKLVEAADKQGAIEAFWLSLAGNNDRAKELIKRYYNRVQDANSYFTSHIEGWKTDMGMIYIIFGTPAKTYKTSDMETWEYSIQNAPPLMFHFEKVRNPFSENCFRLQRSINYKDPWTLAVSHWREGRVYLED
jgi:GWxTD domain-containing protein